LLNYGAEKNVGFFAVIARKIFDALEK